QRFVPWVAPSNRLVSLIPSCPARPASTSPQMSARWGGNRRLARKGPQMDADGRRWGRPTEGILVFGFGFAGDEVLQGFADDFAVVEDGVHFIDDRGGDIEPAR